MNIISWQALPCTKEIISTELICISPWHFCVPLFPLQENSAGIFSLLESSAVMFVKKNFSAIVFLLLFFCSGFLFVCFFPNSSEKAYSCQGKFYWFYLGCVWEFPKVENENVHQTTFSSMLNSPDHYGI